MNQFDKELFLSLCHAYDVELSNTAKEPMLREGNGIRPITEEDIRQIFYDKRRNRWQVQIMIWVLNNSIPFFIWREIWQKLCGWRFISE